jgi:hypothetical protein
MRSTSYFEIILAILALASLVQAPIARGNDDPCSSQGTADQQIKYYCAAAKTADSAKKGQKAVATIQGIVSGVCIASCAGSWTGISEAVCNGVAISGIAGSLAAGKEAAEKFQSLLTGIIPAGTMLLNGSVNAAFTTGTSSINGSCITAAIAGVTSYMSFEGASKSNQTARKNREIARELSSKNTKRLDLSQGKAMSLADSSGSSGASSAALGLNARSQDSKESGTDSLAKLSTACSGDGFTATLSCALAQPDNGIPSVVSDPEFRRLAEKLSGKSLDDLASIEDPAQLITGTLGSTLGDQQKTIIETLEAAKLAALSEAGTAPLLVESRAPVNGSSFLEFGSLAFETPINSSESMSFEKKLSDENNTALSLFSRVSKRYATASRVLAAPTYPNLSALVFRGGQ